MMKKKKEEKDEEEADQRTSRTELSEFLYLISNINRIGDNFVFPQCLIQLRVLSHKLLLALTMPQRIQLLGEVRHRLTQLLKNSHCCCRVLLLLLLLG